MSKKELVGLSSYRHLNGWEEEQRLCYLAEPGAGGSVLFLCTCFADANASISTSFQVDTALFAGSSVRKLPFCRGYN